MFFKKIYLFVFFGGIYNVSTAQNSVHLAPVADALLEFEYNYNSANTNYCTIDNIRALQQPGAVGGLNGSRSVFKFDLSSVAGNACGIESAKLSLFGHGPFGVSGEASIFGSIGQNSCYLQRVITDWDEYTVTWNTQPLTTSLNEVTLPQSAFYNQDYLEIDVTQLVIDMVDTPQQNFGFMMRLVDENLPARALVFCSREFYDSTRRPLLEISFCKDSTGNSINEVPAQMVSILYPDPSENEITITCNENYLHDAIGFFLFDGLGRQLISSAISEPEVKINIGFLNPGIYFYALRRNSFLIKAGRLVVN